MKDNFLSRISLIFGLGVITLAVCANDVQADEVCRPCPFDCRGIGASHKHCDDRGSRYGQCCVDLDNEGKDQLRDKDRENESNRYNDRGRDASAYDDRNGYQPGDCPVGFHVNERKCNDDERRRGCSDLRSPSGQICVGWNQRR